MPDYGTDRDDLLQGDSPTIYIDGEPRRTPGPDVTGAQILALVGKSPDAPWTRRSPTGPWGF